jgi:hypothetical protein
MEEVTHDYGCKPWTVRPGAREEAGGRRPGAREEAGGRRPGAREEAGGRRPGAREEAGEDTRGCVFQRCAAGGAGGGRQEEAGGSRLRAPAARACSGGCALRLCAPAAACSGGACVCLDRERGEATARGRKSPKGPFVPVAVKNRY